MVEIKIQNMYICTPLISAAPTDIKIYYLIAYFSNKYTGKLVIIDT